MPSRKPPAKEPDDATSGGIEGCRPLPATTCNSSSSSRGPYTGQKCAPLVAVTYITVFIHAVLSQLC